MTPQQKTLVRQALLHINLCEMSQYEAMPEVDHTFSERFENKMGKLIHRRQLAIYPLIKTPTRKCVALLVIVFLISSLSLSVSAIREPIFSAFERISEKFTEIIFPKKSKIRLRNMRSVGFPRNTVLSQTRQEIFLLPVNGSMRITILRWIKPSPATSIMIPRMLPCKR